MQSMTTLTIREAAEGDMAAVQGVMAAATAQLRTVYRPTPGAVARARSSTAVRWLIADLDGQCVGALRYVVESDRLHLGLGVRPESQRKGVGRALVDSLAAKAASLGLPKLSLYTIKETGNVAVFARMGFRVVSEEPAKDIESATGEPLTDVYMERSV
jgi:N-acetylglutamate synthase-like GNAT family acetyltransferase